MDTRVIQLDRDVDCADAVRQAVSVLEDGGLVAFPTETVYGVGARADQDDAVKRLRHVKSRSVDQPFTVHIGDSTQALSYAPSMAGVAQRLMRKAWPGPLTLILPIDDPMSSPRMQSLNGSAAAAMYFDNTIGLRCPDNDVARELLRKVSAPIVAASANPAEHPPPHTGKEVLRQLGGQVDLLIDAGRTRYAKPSTIVRIRGSSYEVVRRGVYDARIIEKYATFRLLLICTGNTCRSPMASELARHLLAKRLGCAASELAARSIDVASAGTAGGGGGASPHAVRVMKQRGMDLTGHVSQAVTPDLLQQADKILVMTRSHRQAVLDMLPSARDRVGLLLSNRDISDPIGGSKQDYERCAQAIEEGLQARLQEVVI